MEQLAKSDPELGHYLLVAERLGWTLIDAHANLVGVKGPNWQYEGPTSNPIPANTLTAIKYIVRGLYVQDPAVYNKLVLAVGACFNIKDCFDILRVDVQLLYGVIVNVLKE